MLSSANIAKYIAGKFSPLNPEVLIEKSLLVVEKLHFVRWDTLF